jgi:FtsH-binding integral membrane protein
LGVAFWLFGAFPVITVLNWVKAEGESFVLSDLGTIIFTSLISASVCRVKNKFNYKESIQAQIYTRFFRNYLDT